eukprot:m.323916 g.323916  ORF g.323916 m.323916 type:complete len:77 (-) comp16007_c0_seq2:728-958(-)
MRLHEFDSQVFAVQQGIARVVPLPILCLFTAEQLRELVVGKTEFDIKLLVRRAVSSIDTTTPYHTQTHSTYDIQYS